MQQHDSLADGHWAETHLTEVKFDPGASTGGGSRPSSAEPHWHGGSQR